MVNVIPQRADTILHLIHTEVAVAEAVVGRRILPLADGSEMISGMTWPVSEICRAMERLSLRRM